MQIVHTQKYVKSSPRKLRRVADLVRNMDANEAIAMTPFVGRRASDPIGKVLQAAVGIAKDRKITGKLTVVEIQINEGPDLKRGRAVSRGRWHPYKRRMSHIRVVLETANSQVPSNKLQTKSKSQTTKFKKSAAKAKVDKKPNSKMKTNVKSKKKGSN